MYFYISQLFTSELIDLSIIILSFYNFFTELATWLRLIKCNNKIIVFTAHSSGHGHAANHSIPTATQHSRGPDSLEEESAATEVGNQQGILAVQHILYWIQDGHISYKQAQNLCIAA